MEPLKDDLESFRNLLIFTTNTMKIYNFTQCLQVSTLAAACTAVTLYLFKLMLTKNNPFSFGAWVSDVMVSNVTALACQYYFFRLIVSTIISCDSIYLCWCNKIVAQVNLVGNGIRCIQENVQDDANFYIKCHQLLLRYEYNLLSM